MPRNKIILALVVITLFFLVKFAMQLALVSDGKLHVVVCDVGQGEGIYLRTPKGIHILFDGGPDDSILSCLSRSMPFWERRIDIMMLSHPHADHYTGLVAVLKRYDVKRFITEDVQGDRRALEPLHDAVDSEGIVWGRVFAGDTFKTSDGVTVRVVGPTKEFIGSKKRSGIVDPSDSSLQVLVSYGSYDLLLTGDSNADQMEDVLLQSLPRIEMLQTPHHGSKNGLNAHIIDVLHPKIASISVGKNSYGHPSPFVLDLYKNAHIPYRRTDQKGDMRLYTDGKSYSVK